MNKFHNEVGNDYLQMMKYKPSKKVDPSGNESRSESN